MLNLLIISAISFYSISYNLDEAFSLDEFQWKNRIIIVNSDINNELSDKQKNSLMKEIPGLKERQLLVFEIGKAGIRDIMTIKDYEIDQKLFDQLRLKEGIFELLLIGKDGGVKLRSSAPVAINEIYGLIDQMPMRQAEMRRYKH